MDNFKISEELNEELNKALISKLKQTQNMNIINAEKLIEVLMLTFISGIFAFIVTVLLTI